MSIKDLFGKTSPNLEETVQDVESVAFVEEKTKADQTYHPQIDFSDPENFVYYGSAELYYDAAIRRIYEDYPYDGSKAEQIAFEESASALERWVFENKYPKTTGHIQLGTTGEIIPPSGGQPVSTTTSPEAIRIWGGLHTDGSTNLKDKFGKSAKFDEDKNRNQNWNCDFEKGVTIEFWMKKDSYDAANNPSEIVLDLWNGKSGAEQDRLLISIEELSGVLKMTSFVIFDGFGIDTKCDMILGEWFHFATTFHIEDGLFKASIYLNGELVDSRTLNAPSSTGFSGLINGFIGSLQGAFNGIGETYAAKFEGYLDEFRFWKTKRTARQIKLNWFQPIGGGANTDDATSDLGVYLKFNEGIVGDNQVDNVVLDYSGRLANGLWIGYENTTNARSTESAIESLGYTEKPSPIIYKDHPEVKDLISEMRDKGVAYDADRGQSFFRSMPTWLQEEDNGNLRLFAQILGSYLDTLHVQIKELTELKTKRYPMEGVKASTMAADLLKDKGFMISNMFESNEVYEKLASVNLQDAQFETELTEIKNIIYTNIYNNLEKIYKTKGTEGSIRNLIRCYGIDDELIRLNLYTDGGIQYFTDKSRPTSVKKKYLNFNHPDRFGSTIFQAGARSFISEAVDASRNAFTLEADIVVPYKKEVGETGYFATPFLSSSVMGFHEANASDSSDLTWGTQNLQVFLVKDSQGSRHAKFVMKNQNESIYQESDYIYDIYENEHYNVALRITPETYPYAGGVSNATPQYYVELYAVTTNFGEIENEVILSQTIDYADGLALMNAAKRVYAGAHRVDMNVDVQESCDIQIGGVRAWLDYLDNEAILSHNKDVLNYGQNSSIDGSNLYLIDDVQIPTQDLTILNWDFDTVLTSDSSGEFEIEDITGGHDDEIYGWIDDIIRREHKAKGSNFPLSDSSFVGYEFIQAYKKQLPESAYDAQNIYIKGEQEINFSDDDDVSDNLFIMEKSPAALISEEMLKSFSTTLEFANLIGRPVERFRLEYKDLAKARQLFFDKVESDMDFDKFFEYFKWIDSSISSMVNQLIPMSANFAGGIVDVVEPHMLERDKYQRQVGLLNTVTSTEASIRGVQELKYNWRVGHAPLSGDENENCLWQKERKENDVAEEEAIRQVLVRQNDQEYTNPVVLSGSTQLISGSYAARRFSRPYTLDIGFNNSIHGGINYSENKDRDMITTQISVGNSKSSSGVPENVVLVGAGSGNGTVPKPSCIDEHRPEELRKYKYDGYAVLGQESELPTLTPKGEENQYTYRQKLSKILPGNIVSSSVETGYSGLINKSAADGGFAEGYDLVNLHSDTTDITNEISIQGPFTNEHVGGRQARHVHHMHGFDETLGKVPTTQDRPEAWNIYIGELDRSGDGNPESNTDGAIGFTTPDYSLNQLDIDAQKATLYREERAKRPINIKNIKTNLWQDENGEWHQEGPLGNFTRNYEAMSTFGDQGYFLRRNEDLLPQPIAEALPETTNYYTLIAQTTSVSGNYFGANNNRQFDLVTTLASPAVASFIMHQDGGTAAPSALPDQRIDIARAVGSTITFAITNNASFVSGDLDGSGYTVVSTNGKTWSDMVAEFETAIEHPTNGFGGDVIVVGSYDASGLNGEQVAMFISENTLVGTNGNGGTLVNTTTAPDDVYFDEVTSGFEGGTDSSTTFLSMMQAQDRSTGSAHVIRTRFSAPGGPEVNSSGYLDVATQQYSVHNSLNYRNLTVRANGSGEYDRIRVNSHAGRREGLGILRSRHQGKFGLDSKWGAATGDASFHKQHRNNNEMPYTVLDEKGIEIAKVRNDNDHYHRPLPATDFQYSWINNALNGEDAPDQPILERAPKSGMVIGSDGYVPAINFPAISDFDQNLCLIPRELRIPIVNITSNGQLYSLSSANNLVNVLPTVDDFLGTGTEMIPSDWSTLDLDYQFASCCTEDPEFSLNSGEWTTTVPTSEIPAGPIYYSPGSNVYLDYRIKDCLNNIGRTNIRFADASYTSPTFSAKLLYTAERPDGGSEYISAFMDTTLIVAKDLSTRQTGEILPPYLSPDDAHAYFKFLCNSTLDSGQAINHIYYGQYSDGQETVYPDESEDFSYYHSPGLSLVVTYSPQAKLLEDSISITLNDASYGEPSVDLNFQIVQGISAKGTYIYTTIPNPSFSEDFYRFCIDQAGGFTQQCPPYEAVGNFTIDDFNDRTTLFVVSDNLNVGEPGSYTQFKYRLSDIATGESEPNWQSIWLTGDDPTQVPFINYNETPIEQPGNAGFKRRVEVVYFDYDDQGDLHKFNTYLQILILNVDMQRTETENARAILNWTWGENDENSETESPTTRTDIVVGQFKYINEAVYQNLTTVRNKDLLNMTVSLDHSWGSVPEKYREAITSAEFRRINVASDSSETVVTDWTAVDIYDEVNVFSPYEQFGYTDVVGELFVRKIEIRFNGYSEEWHKHSFYTWATIVVEDLEVTQLYTVGLI